jgi:hypothetical protein
MHHCIRLLTSCLMLLLKVHLFRKQIVVTRDWLLLLGIISIVIWHPSILITAKLGLMAHWFKRPIYHWTRETPWLVVPRSSQIVVQQGCVSVYYSVLGFQRSFDKTSQKDRQEFVNHLCYCFLQLGVLLLVLEVHL